MTARIERTSQRGGMRLYRADASRVSLVLFGCLSSEDAEALADWLENELPQCEGAVIAVDTEGLESYASSVRTMAQRVLLDHGERWSLMHALVGSRIVAMGLAVANVALGGRIRMYTDRASFESATVG